MGIGWIADLGSHEWGLGMGETWGGAVCAMGLWGWAAVLACGVE